MLNLSSSVFIFPFSCIVSLPKQIFVSSAKRINFNNVEVLKISLIYSINNLGPETKPCGIPQVNFNKSDSQLSKATFCNRFCNQSKVMPLML